MGPSGCGELARCLSGLDVIDGGEIVVDGSTSTAVRQQKTDSAPARWFRLRFYNLLPVLSAVENVGFLSSSGTSAQESRRRAIEALDRCTLPNGLTTVGKLSGGQRRRVASPVPRQRPGDSVGDEPTGDLDSTNAQRIMDLLCDLNQAAGRRCLVTAPTSPRAPIAPSTWSTA
jgi:ABC-type lipoprotein export system ATPase subunit